MASGHTTFRCLVQFLGMKSFAMYASLLPLNGAGTHSTSYLYTISTTCKFKQNAKQPSNLHSSTAYVHWTTIPCQNVERGKNKIYTSWSMKTANPNWDENHANHKKYWNHLSTTKTNPYIRQLITKLELCDTQIHNYTNKHLRFSIICLPTQMREQVYKLVDFAEWTGIWLRNDKNTHQSIQILLSTPGWSSDTSSLIWILNQNHNS